MLGRVVIRLVRLADAPAIARIYGPIVASTAISFETEPPSIADIEARITAALTRVPWVVEERDGVVVGYAYASKHRDRAAYQWAADASVYVDEQHRRSGVARRLYSAVFDLLRLQGFYVVHAGVTLPNAASVGFHESMGFLPVGVYRGVGYKLGAWHDVGWWQLVLRERAPAPAAPRPLADALEDARRAGVVEA